MRSFKTVQDVLMHADEQSLACRRAADRYAKAGEMLKNGYTKKEVATALGFKPMSQSSCYSLARDERAKAFAYDDIATAFEQCIEFNERCSTESGGHDGED